MNLFLLVWSYLKAKPLNTLLSVILMTMGTGVITVLLLFNKQFESKMTDNSRGIDLVVGAKGSPLQLILCSIYHIDFPTGNINLLQADKLARNRMVKKAIPLALGDSYQGFRIVGTDTAYSRLYNAELATGSWWNKDLEVTVGAAAAERLKISVGSTFASAHGLTSDGHDHEENKYVVIGIMKPTGTALDNLLLTNVASIWKVHDAGHGTDSIKHNLVSKLVPPGTAIDSTREITSLLIKFRNPVAALQLPRMINSQTTMQAASPAFETARLFSILSVGVRAMFGLALTIIAVSALSIFIVLYNSLKERRYDLAIMRAMGASRPKLLLTVLSEGVMLTAAGSILGVATGHFILFLFTNFVEEGARTGMTALAFYSEEWWLMALSVLIGIVVALVPAVQAYRTDIHKVLSGN